MNIIFEKTSGIAPGAQPQSRSHARRNTPRELNSFDPLGPALERSNAFQTFIDIAAVLFGFLVASIIGLAVVYAFAVCLFLSVT